MLKEDSEMIKKGLSKKYKIVCNRRLRYKLGINL